MKTKPRVDTHEVEIIFERLWKLSSASSSALLPDQLCRVNHNKLVQNIYFGPVTINWASSCMLAELNAGYIHLFQG